ncbi:MAG: hypothetical protein JWR38_2490 [Mucilaginibacter sp.]|nr:hypothetical protein [Mucilaginibacter sp.]
MKKLSLILPALILLIIASCKKDNTPVKPVDDKPTTPVIAVVKDSASYTIDGKTYTANEGSTSIHVSNSQVNCKAFHIENGLPNEYEIIGDKDSVLYSRESLVLSSSTRLTITFTKKSNKKALNYNGFMYYPSLAEILKIYSPGKHQYAEDYEREQSKDGIALTISANGKSYTSYSTLFLPRPTIYTPGFQNDNTFEVISFVKNDEGTYNLEAKFSAVVIEDWDVRAVKLEKGYLRLRVDLSIL